MPITMLKGTVQRLQVDLLLAVTDLLLLLLGVVGVHHSHLYVSQIQALAIHVVVDATRFSAVRAMVAVAPLGRVAHVMALDHLVFLVLVLVLSYQVLVSGRVVVIREELGQQQVQILIVL